MGLKNSKKGLNKMPTLFHLLSRAHPMLLNVGEKDIVMTVALIDIIYFGTHLVSPQNKGADLKWPGLLELCAFALQLQQC